jgi:hypothetical protein
MVKKRSNGSAPGRPGNARRPPPRPPRRPGLVQSSIYLPTAMHDALREVAFRERCKIHDLMLEGIALVLGKRKERPR